MSCDRAIKVESGSNVEHSIMDSIMTAAASTRQLKVLLLLLGAVLLFATSTSAQGFTARNCPRSGLCPYVKRLVPDLHSHPVMEHYQPHAHGVEPPSLCGNLCTHDRQCPSDLKCCPTNCGYACFPPVHVVDNQHSSPDVHHHPPHPHGRR